MTRRLISALAIVLALTGCATVELLSGSSAAQSQAGGAMLDRVALGYGAIAALAGEVSAGVRAGTLPPAAASDQLARLRQAKAALDTASDLYLAGRGTDAQAQIRIVDTLLAQVRLRLAERKTP